MTIIDILRKFKYHIPFILAFVLLENVAWIVEPTFFGRLLDALIDHFYAKEKIDYFTPLFIWAFVYLLNVAGGTLHRYFSGIIYPKIYADTATRVITYSRKRGFDSSKVFARAELAKEYVIFLKERLPEVIWQLSATLGTIIALYFYDWRIASLAVLVIIPIAFINRSYLKNVVTLQRTLHDKREDQYRVIETGDERSIRDYFFHMVAPQVKIARWSSASHLIIKVLLLFIFLGVLFIAVDLDRFSTGMTYAIVSYIWTFIASTDYIPGLMESTTAVQELNSRLREEEI